jgi:hypothetical protein
MMIIAAIEVKTILGYGQYRTPAEAAQKESASGLGSEAFPDAEE